MNGWEVGQLMNKWELGGHLTDKELQYLMDNMQFINDFCLQTGHRYIASYLITQINSMRMAMDARKTKQ